ncbi:hypothetical protein [Spirosoma sp. 48-14]|uniref:hypothetical protein n=1 Tax=Spirosoma sp. 48-14 TaxID=1895854 RepID=UPI00095DA9AA|nr:hypothetical protein [Spirosoma sp. 48-14]OJW75669.1 MAG: hypothetical protein BGO59_08865 [Spirosoma sp. 48-14]
MINIVRSPQAPKSLDNAGIRKYLDELEAYKNDQQLPPEQQTLKKPKCHESYRNTDLFEAFDDCFFKKCYLTEEAFFTSWAMDVEHFVPQNEKPELKYIWSNLYPASHDANMMKPRNTPDGGYLNPCEPIDDVENDLLYFFDYENDAVHFEAVDPSNKKATNTAKLLQKLHNGDSEETHRKTAELRNAIHKRFIRILELIIEWRQAREVSERHAEFEAARKLKALLSRKASFTMLMRSIKAVRDLPSEFFD